VPVTLPLTEKQERVWRYIKSCERSPSYQELAQAMGHKVRGAAVYRVVEQLVDKGFVRRGRYGQTRSLVPLDPRLDLAGFSTAELAAEIARRTA
jgi:Fe2+ or Zn2+ uptake regulation protein